MSAPIRLGFMPLLDAAIPVAAARRGFARTHGIAIDLVRETSWANIRDRLAIGHFDAAHLLAPMPVAAALGLTPLDVPIIAPIALGLGGNAITVSAGLWQQMQKHAPEAMPGDPAAMGTALRQLVKARQARGSRRLVFGVVHPFSAHNYELRYWLAASGMRPDNDIEIAVMPPPFMPDALAAETLDGFCVGEPWNTVAALRGGARIILTKSAIWQASPEKVLGLRTRWAEEDPNRFDALLCALIDAARWCGDRANHEELAQLLGAPDLLAMPAGVLMPALAGAPPLPPHGAGEFLTYHDHAANFPWRSHALWFFSQMCRWRQARATPDQAVKAAAAFRPDLFRRAAHLCGLNVPAIDEKIEGGTGGVWMAPGVSGALALPRGGFFDGTLFDPDAFRRQVAAAAD